jgi:hypothetical protein
MTLDLTDEEARSLAADDPYAISPGLAPLRAILEKRSAKTSGGATAASVTMRSLRMKAFRRIAKNISLHCRAIRNGTARQFSSDIQ